MKRPFVSLVLLFGCGGAVKPESPAPRPTAAAEPSVDAPAPPEAVGTRSQGCGVQAFAGDGSFKRHTLWLSGVERTYHLFVPRSYDSARAYPLIFRWHGMGGDGVSGGLGIEQVAGDAALVVGADGLEQRWAEANRAQDIALFDAMLTELGARYCIDLSRVYSYGFSSGGAFTNELACARAHVLRASAAIASRPAKSACSGATATWLLHDVNDDAVPIALGYDARDRALSQNGCSGTAEPAEDGCVVYRDCRAGEPVVWCETKGYGHDIRGDYAPAVVWRFFMGLP